MTGPAVRRRFSPTGRLSRSPSSSEPPPPPPSCERRNSTPIGTATIAMSATSRVTAPPPRFSRSNTIYSVMLTTSITVTDTSVAPINSTIEPVSLPPTSVNTNSPNAASTTIHSPTPTMVSHRLTPSPTGCVGGGISPGDPDRAIAVLRNDAKKNVTATRPNPFTSIRRPLGVRLRMKDRFRKAIQGEPVDRPPVWMMRQAGRYLPEYREIRESHSFREAILTPDIATEISLQPYERFQPDGVVMYSDILTVLEPLGFSYHIESGVGPVVENPVSGPDDVDRSFGNVAHEL